MNTITILIVDDHTMVREAWTIVLAANNQFRVVGGCHSAEEAIEAVKQLRPDVVLMDVSLPGMSGIDAVPLIRKYAPKAKILGISLHALPLYARKMIRSGANGYISKHATREEMETAILKVYNGEKFIGSHIKDLIAQQLEETDDPAKNIALLSPRELEVIAQVKEGLSSKEMAARLCVSVKTIEVHRYNILRKLGLRNSAELVNFISRFLPVL